MELESTFINGVYLLKRKPLRDSRGYLERLFCQTSLDTILLHRSIRQLNHTFTLEDGAVRGLHFQYPPHAEMKIVSCLRGSVFDVVVDLRKDSPTFLCYYSTIISEENQCSIVIPEGVAHGFQTLKSNCEMLYLHTADYSPNNEGGLNALDPLIGIRWPKEIKQQSNRDMSHPMLPDNFLGIELL